MKIKVNFTAVEVATAIIGFGLDVEFNYALLKFFGLTKGSCDCGKFDEETLQSIYGHAVDTTRYLELYATAEVELIDGRKVTMQELDDMFYGSGEFYQKTECGVLYTVEYISSKVKGAIVEFEIKH
jgi:hypothetical protein